MSSCRSRVRMRKQLDLFNGIAIIIGIIFGSGIFISPSQVLFRTGSLWASIIVWILCGFLAALGALSYCELGTILIQSGGDYQYIKRAYGNLPAFLYLWDANLVFIPTTNAIMALTFASNVIESLMPSCEKMLSLRKIIAACAICLLTFLNAYSMKITTRLQGIFLYIKIFTVSVIILGGFVWVIQNGLGNFENGWSGTSTSLSEWSVAFFSGTFSYSGWNYLNFMSEELCKPYDNLPRAIYISLPLVTGAYVLGNLAYLAVLGTQGVLASEAIAVDFSIKALSWMHYVMPVFVIVAIFGGLSVHIMTSSRMCFAGARNGHMPELLSYVNTQCLTPLPALIFLMLMSLLMLIPDNISTLVTYCTVVESFFSTMACSTVLWLRYSHPELSRPIRVPLWMPILYVAITSVLLLVPVFSDPMAVLIGIAVTLAGVPIYYKIVVNSPVFVRRMTIKFTHACQKLLYSAVEDEEL